MCLLSWFWKSYLSLIPISFLLNSQYGLYPRIHRNCCDKIKWYFFPLSSILALNHISCHFFQFLLISFTLPLSAVMWLGVWSLVWISSFSLVSELPHSLCHPCCINMPPLIFSVSGCASPRVSSGVSQNILCYTVSLKAHPWEWGSPYFMKCWVWEMINIIFLLRNRCSVNIFWINKRMNEWTYTSMYFGKFLREEILSSV